jgi:hypothetical protein
MLAKGVGKNDDSSEVAAASDERGVGVLLAAGSIGSAVRMLRSFAAQVRVWSMVSSCLKYVFSTEGCGS